MFLNSSSRVHVSIPQVSYQECKTHSTLLLKDDHLVKEAGITAVLAHLTRFYLSLSLRLNRKVRLYMYVCAHVRAWVSMHAYHPTLPLSNRHHIKGSTLLHRFHYQALSCFFFFLVKPNTKKITWEGNKIEVWWFGEPESLLFHACCVRDFSAISSLKYSGINYITEVWCVKWNT